MGAVVRGRIAALGAMTAAVMAGLVPLPALAALSVVVAFLGACEVRSLGTTFLDLTALDIRLF